MTRANRTSLSDSINSVATCTFHSLECMRWLMAALLDPLQGGVCDAALDSDMVSRNWWKRSHSEWTNDADDLTFNCT